MNVSDRRTIIGQGHDQQNDTNQLETMRSFAALSPAFVVSLALVHAKEQNREDYEYDPQKECELFIAPSTIQGAGLGLFTAVPKKENDIVGNGDPALPLIDSELNSGDPYFFMSIFSNYVWSGVSTAMGFEAVFDFVNTYWPGMDCAINSHLALNNVQTAQPRQDDSLYYTDLSSPSAGSVTPFRNGTSRVAKNIPAGGELFKNYGDNWFISREHMFGKLPLPDDYPQAEKLIRLFDMVSKRTNFNQKYLYTFLLEFDDIWDSRTLKALPKDFQQINKVVQFGIDSIHQPNATHSLDFLRRNGKCIDHIVPKPSSISNIGEGAFAKRRLPKGTVITGSPILHAPPELFDMYDFEKPDPFDPYTWERKSIVGQQIILNYCFSNHMMDLVLCPYGSGVSYLNHHRERANVRLQWATDGTTGQNDEWFKIPPENMTEFKTNLAIDYIATRDIEEGEELFLDYGDHWVAAWESHVENWKPPSRPKDDAKFWNDLREPIRTSEEQLESPYPEHLMLRCHSNLLYREFKQFNDTWDRTDRYQLHSKGALYGQPCEILSRNDTDETYSILIYIDHLTTHQMPEGYLEEQPDRSKVPRDGIYFENAPGTSDYLQEGVFRHYIGLSDEMIPAAWKRKPSSPAKDPIKIEL